MQLLYNIFLTKMPHHLITYLDSCILVEIKNVNNSVNNSNSDVRSHFTSIPNANSVFCYQFITKFAENFYQISTQVQQ